MNYLIGRSNFCREINLPEEQIDLAKAALYIAQEEHPELEVEESLNALDTMAQEVREHLPQESYPLKIIKSLNQYLYEDLKFEGNTTHYYDPLNSFLNAVIDRRTGIPITLSLVYLEIAKRIDFPMVGVGMPGHFLVRPNFEGTGIFVDAFHRGEVLFEQDCEALLSKIYQQPIKLQPKFLEPITNRQFLARMLTNLKGIYIHQQEPIKILAAVERILLLFPDVPTEIRDRGLLHYQLGAAREAIRDLESYLAMVPQARDAEAIRKLLARIVG